MIKTISAISEKLDNFREVAVQRGDSVGFRCLDALYSLKQGSFTCILAPPGNGKTEFALELAFNQAMKYGKRCLLNTPETGNVEEIAAELIHKYTGKSIYKTNQSHCDEAEYQAGKNWIDHHFLILDTEEKSYSFQEMFDLADEWEKQPEQKQNGDKIHLVIADPWNELHHDMGDPKYHGRQDLYIEDVMGWVRRKLARSKRHMLICLHPASQQTITKDGHTYYPMPNARQAAGGQALLRKAFCWINIWRPPVGLPHPGGGIYTENQLIVQIEKAKPKGVATKGETFLYFDWKRNRYYEEFGGRNFYAFDHEKGYATRYPSENTNYF